MFSLALMDKMRDPPIGSPCQRSKAHRALVPDGKGTLQGHAGLDDRTFLKQSPDERNAMRHPSRWREAWQRMTRIRRPVAARLIYLDKARPQGQRGMPGEVCDNEHFVS